MKKWMFRQEWSKIPVVKLNAKYQEKLIGKIVCRYAGRMFLPYPLRACVTNRQIREISLERFTVLMAPED